MIHTMGLQDKYFEKMKIGEKIYEVRLNDEKRKLIKIGDTIIFEKYSNKNEKLKVKVTDLLMFSSFNEMATSLGSLNIGFENSSLQDIVKVYHEFYSLEDENKYGVLAIKVQI